MKLTASIFLLFSLTAALGLSDAFAGQKVYKWVDEDGVVHFDDQPPPGRDVEAIEATEAYRPGSAGAYAEGVSPEEGEADLNAAEQTRQKMADQSARRKAEHDQLQKLCDHYRQVVAELEPHRRVFYQDENGETVRMDDVERVNKVDEAKAYLATNCSS